MSTIVNCVAYAGGPMAAGVALEDIGRALSEANFSLTGLGQNGVVLAVRLVLPGRGQH